MPARHRSPPSAWLTVTGVVGCAFQGAAWLRGTGPGYTGAASLIFHSSPILPQRERIVTDSPASFV